MGSISDSDVVCVAHLIRDREQYSPRANAVADRCDRDDLLWLVERLDHYDRTREVPPDFRPDETAPVARWFAFFLEWKEAICETLYQTGERALPVLRWGAFLPDRPGVQGPAFSVLCRLAAEGVATDRFFDDMEREFGALPAPE